MPMKMQRFSSNLNLPTAVFRLTRYVLEYGGQILVAAPHGGSEGRQGGRNSRGGGHLAARIGSSAVTVVPILRAFPAHAHPLCACTKGYPRFCKSASAIPPPLSSTERIMRASRLTARTPIPPRAKVNFTHWTPMSGDLGMIYREQKSAPHLTVPASSRQSCGQPFWCAALSSNRYS
jgi:hypothetical protein